jgi:hypothetical protein
MPAKKKADDQELGPSNGSKEDHELRREALQLAAMLPRDKRKRLKVLQMVHEIEETFF